MDLRPCRREIESLGGSIAWVSNCVRGGIGVSFAGVKLHDQDLCALRETLPRVVWLDLSESPITDAGLMELRSARCLEALSIDGTRITAAGLLGLRSLPKLVQIHAADTAVAAEDVQRLRQAGWTTEINVHRSGACCGWFPGIDAALMAGIMS
ncbi:MAG: hypothetical protein SFV23_09720 [Planctomycetaceae bacterium]|nr:hypothetical protein [Planctomycetaceae bacterium]